MKRKLYGYDIPGELEEQILLKLPVKTLLRFRSVCRSWNSLITDQKFVNDHLQVNTHKSNAAFSDSNAYSSFLVAFNQELESLLTINGNYTATFKETYVPTSGCKIDVIPFIDHCHGIVCRFDMFGNQRVIFYNSALRQHKSVSTPAPVKFSFSYGFGHDPKSDDYKLVKIQAGKQIMLTAEVYSLRTGRWREFEMDKDKFPYGHGVYVKGRCFWPNFNARNFVSFDMSNESFGVLDMPPTNGNKRDPLLMARGDSLVCIVDTFEVWVMDLLSGGGVWVKQCEIGVVSESFLKPIAFWKEDELFTNATNQDTFSYNLRTKKLRKLPFMRKISSYVESLVSVTP